MRHLPSTPVVIRTLILLDEKISTDELQAKLEALGITLSKFTVGHIRLSFLAILKLLRSHGLLRDKKLPDPDWLDRSNSRLGNLKFNRPQRSSESGNFSRSAVGNVKKRRSRSSEKWRTEKRTNFRKWDLD